MLNSATPFTGITNLRHLDKMYSHVGVNCFCTLRSGPFLLKTYPVGCCVRTELS